MGLSPLAQRIMAFHQNRMPYLKQEDTKLGKIF